MLLGLYIVAAAQPQDVYSESRLYFNDYYHYGVDSRINFKPMIMCIIILGFGFILIKPKLYIRP